MGIFDGIEKEQPSERGSYISNAGVGMHKVMISRLVKKEKGRRGRTAIVEVVMLEGGGPKANPGSTYSWVQKGEHEGFLARQIGFVIKATGYAKEDIDEEAMETLYGETQPLAGLILCAEGYEGESDKNKVAAVWTNWHPIADPKELKRLAEVAKKLRVYPSGGCKLQADALK